MDPDADTPAGLVVVDAANVIGARPDGWWKDRAGAAERLIDQLAAAHRVPELTGRRVVVVLEGRGVDASTEGHDVAVVRAPRDGDATIVDVVREHQDDDVLVVTSDRELRRRVEALGARTVGAGWLRDLLDAPAE